MTEIQVQIKVAKFSLYPRKEPTGFAVGFNVTLQNGRSFYRDTVVPLEEVEDKGDDEIVQLAWDEMEDSILSRVEGLAEHSPLLGKGWVPRGYETISDESTMIRVAKKAEVKENGEEEAELREEDGEEELEVGEK